MRAPPAGPAWCWSPRPGATNAVTGIVDALMDSIPMVVITGQVATHLIGTDAFQECDTVGITRPCTKQNYLVKSVEELPRIIHEAFHIATSGRPGPVVIDIPKDVQFAKGPTRARTTVTHLHAYAPRLKGDARQDRRGRGADRQGQAPILYTGGGVINAGPRPRNCCANSRADRRAGHLDPDGPGRLPGLGPAVAGHGRACTAHSSPTTPCTTATSWWRSARASTTG
jgi:hypothetical protein